MQGSVVSEVIPPRKVVVVIPTFNEAGNIEAVITGVIAALPDASILVVDDNSPDGTGALVRGAMASESHLHLIERAGKLGLGTAYLAGFAYGLEHGFDHILTMDCDFSHKPSYLPDLIHGMMPPPPPLLPRACSSAVCDPVVSALNCA